MCWRGHFADGRDVGVGERVEARRRRRLCSRCWSASTLSREYGGAYGTCAPTYSSAVVDPDLERPVRVAGGALDLDRGIPLPHDLAPLRAAAQLGQDRQSVLDLGWVSTQAGTGLPWLRVRCLVARPSMPGFPREAI